MPFAQVATAAGRLGRWRVRAVTRHGKALALQTSAVCIHMHGSAQLGLTWLGLTGLDWT